MGKPDPGHFLCFVKTSKEFAILRELRILNQQTRDIEDRIDETTFIGPNLNPGISSC